MRVCGKVQVEVQHNQQVSNLLLLIVEDSGPALLGWNWLRDIQLDWKSIHSIYFAFGEQPLPDLLTHHSAVFNPGLGTMHGRPPSISCQALPQSFSSTGVFPMLFERQWMRSFPGWSEKASLRSWSECGRKMARYDCVVITNLPLTNVCKCIHFLNQRSYSTS